MQSPPPAEQEPEPPPEEAATKQAAAEGEQSAADHKADEDQAPREGGIRHALQEVVRRTREQAQRGVQTAVDPSRQRQNAVAGAWLAAVVGAIAAFLGWSHHSKSAPSAGEGAGQLVIASYTSQPAATAAEESALVQRLACEVWAIDGIDRRKARGIHQALAPQGYDLILGSTERDAKAPRPQPQSAIVFRNAALTLHAVTEYNPYLDADASARQSSAPPRQAPIALVAHFETAGGLPFLVVHWPEAPAVEAMERWREWLTTNFPKLVEREAVPLFFISNDVFGLYELSLSGGGPLEPTPMPEDKMAAATATRTIQQGARFDVRIAAVGLEAGAEPAVPELRDGPVAVEPPWQAELQSRLSQLNLSLSELKQLLATAGHYGGKVDDSLGEEVRTAILEFQGAIGLQGATLLSGGAFRQLVTGFQTAEKLPADGMLGPATRKALRDRIGTTSGADY